MLIRKLAAELLGTALLVFLAVGTATLAFGFQLHGGSFAAGVVMTALAFVLGSRAWRPGRGSSWRTSSAFP
jgi:aquaporin Z